MILDTIAESARIRVRKEKEKVSLREMKQTAFDLTPGTAELVFENALKKQDVNFICEVKKASPSKGIIAEDFPYVKIAKEYEEAGAACISVLTEPEYFLGSDEYLKEIKKEVRIPLLRKDFTVDEYQIYQARVLGADAVLLICSLLTEETLKEYLAICNELCLSALVEAHTEEEIHMAVRQGARILGVNNRNLKTFEVDIHNAERRRALVPEDILFVAESGIKTAEDVDILRKAGVNGVLIGETLMRASDKKEMLFRLSGNKKVLNNNLR